MRPMSAGRCRAALYAGTTTTSFMARLAWPHGRGAPRQRAFRSAGESPPGWGQHLGEGQAWPPVEEPSRLGHGGDAHGRIVVAGAVELGGALAAQAWQGAVRPLRTEGAHQLARQGTDADIVPVVAEVQDLALAPLGPLDDAQEGIDEFVDVEEGAPLATAADQNEILTGKQGMHERGEDAWNAFAVHARDEIHAWPDDVERPHHGETQAVMLAVRPDHTLEQLLGRGIGPALAMAGAKEERGPILVHAPRRATIDGEGAPAIDLAGGEVNQPALALGAQLDQGHEIGVAGVDHLKRARVVEGGIAQGGERDDDVGARGDLSSNPVSLREASMR